MRTNQNVSYVIKDLKIWKNFATINKLHKDYFGFHEKEIRREPAPGDVTVF
jgi:hypothetical protein